MTALPHDHSLSIEEYLELDQSSLEIRYEYIDGQIIMLAGGSTHHAIISATMTGILYNALRGQPCRVYSSDIRISLSETRYVYPDVVVSCDARDHKKNMTIYYPCLVIEVLSPSTETKDRGKKFFAYRECPTIQEYILVNTEYQAIEVYRREKNNFWSYKAFLPGEDVTLEFLGVCFPVSEVYAGLSLSEDEPE
jgi:Uma2 family endonuclease